MEEKNMVVECSSCKQHFDQLPQKTFLGFRVFKCPSCAANITYPMSNGFMLAHIVFLVLFVSMLVQAKGLEEAILPLVAAAIIVYALIKNIALKVQN